MIRTYDIHALGIMGAPSDDGTAAAAQREAATAAAQRAFADAGMSRRTAVSLALALVCLVLLWRMKFTLLGLGVAGVAYLSYTGGRIDTARAVKAAREAASSVVDVADDIAAEAMDSASG